MGGCRSGRLRSCSSSTRSAVAAVALFTLSLCNAASGQSAQPSNSDGVSSSSPVNTAAGTSSSHSDAGLDEQAEQAQRVVVWVCTPVAVLSLAMLIVGLLEVKGCMSCRCLPVWFMPAVHGLGILFWGLVIPLTAFLLAQRELSMIAFLVFACLAVLAHCMAMATLIRKAIQARYMERPQQQLLIPDRNGTEARRTGDEETLSPPVLGVIPGTSHIGYILWLPTTDGWAGSPYSSQDRTTGGGRGPPPPVQIPPGGYPYGGYQPAPSPSDVAGQRVNMEDRLMGRVPQQSSHPQAHRG